MKAKFLTVGALLTTLANAADAERIGGSVALSAPVGAITSINISSDGPMIARGTFSSSFFHSQDLNAATTASTFSGSGFFTTSSPTSTFEINRQVMPAATSPQVSVFGNNQNFTIAPVSGNFFGSFGW